MKNNHNYKTLAAAAAANIIEFAKLVIRSRFFDSSMIQQFKKASSGSGSNKKSFDSTAFTVHRTTWCLQCYPAGDKYADNGMSSLYLKILEFPDGGGHHIKNMKVRMQFECPDIQYESEEFIHIYENKKQEVYFGISSAFNTLQLNYLSKNQGIVVKCRIDLISVSIAGERWWNCIRERDNLRAKTKRIGRQRTEHREPKKRRNMCAIKWLQSRNKMPKFAVK
eukprot:10168_1